MKRNKTILIITWIILSISTSFAQHENRDYVVLNNNDTLYGKVAHINEKHINRDFYKKIRFVSENGKKKKFKKKELLAFKTNNTLYQSFMITEFTDGGLFDQIRYTIDNKYGEKVFYRVVSLGKLSHYQLEWKEQGESLIMLMDLIKKENTTYFIRATQGILGLKRKALVNYFYDCPELQEKITNKEIKQISELIIFYNANCGV